MRQYGFRWRISFATLAAGRCGGWFPEDGEGWSDDGGRAGADGCDDVGGVCQGDPFRVHIEDRTVSRRRILFVHGLYLSRGFCRRLERSARHGVASK